MPSFLPRHTMETTTCPADSTSGWPASQALVRDLMHLSDYPDKQEQEADWAGLAGTPPHRNAPGESHSQPGPRSGGRRDGRSIVPERHAGADREGFTDLKTRSISTRAGSPWRRRSRR